MAKKRDNNNITENYTDNAAENAANSIIDDAQDENYDAAPGDKGDSIAEPEGNAVSDELSGANLAEEDANIEGDSSAKDGSADKDYFPVEDSDIIQDDSFTDAGASDDEGTTYDSPTDDNDFSSEDRSPDDEDLSSEDGSADDEDPSSEDGSADDEDIPTKESTGAEKDATTENSAAKDSSSSFDDEIIDLDEGKVYDDIDENTTGRKKRTRFNINLIVLVAILVIALFCIFRLWLWNRGVKISFDPNEDTSQYDYEALDSILPLDPKYLEGHEDDGVTTILFIGNSPLMASGEAGSIADLTVSTLESKGKKAEAINAPVSFSTLACINDSYDAETYADDAAALPNLVDALVSGDFSIQDADITENHGDSTTSLSNLKALEEVDMNKVDVLCIFYDANDYFFGRQLISNGDKDSVNSALIYSVKKIQENYPWIRIILMTPYYCQGVDVEGNTFDPDITSNNIERLPMYIMKEIQTAAELSITVVDNYYGSINGSNYNEYMDENRSLTEAGIEKLAARLMYALTYYDN